MPSCTALLYTNHSTGRALLMTCQLRPTHGCSYFDLEP